jgi:alpha-N-arabinofuranosidase
MLSFDEWNVWYRTRRNRQERVKSGWPVAPEILEEPYNMLDALTFGGACISLLNHADRVKVACLAQLVNVIAPIMTETGGAAWRQTIFYPFAHFSNLGRGNVLRATVNSPTYPANCLDPRGEVERFYPLPAVPYLKLSAVHDDKAGTLTLFALNRHLKDDMTVDFTTKGFGKLAVGKAHQLHDEDLKALNTAKNPDRIQPLPLRDIKIREGGACVTLRPASWNVLQLKAGK